MSNYDLFNSFAGPDEDPLGNCRACAAFGQRRPAIGRSIHPDYRHVDLCAECLALYDSGNPESLNFL